MPQKGKNIYQRKDGRWEGRYIREERRPEKLYMGMSTPIPMRK